MGTGPGCIENKGVGGHSSPTHHSDELSLISPTLSLIDWYYSRIRSYINIYVRRIPFLLYRKGISQSALPYRRSVPTWLKLTSDDVKDQIYKLAKKGLTPSQIGKYSTQFVHFLSRMQNIILHIQVFLAWTWLDVSLWYSQTRKYYSGAYVTTHKSWNFTNDIPNNEHQIWHFQKLHVVVDYRIDKICK